MHVCDKTLYAAFDVPLETFSTHWAGCVAMMIQGKPLDRSKWPLRSSDVSDEDYSKIQALRDRRLI